MKIFFCFLALIPSTLFAQNRDEEMKQLNKLMNDGKIDKEEAIKRRNELNLLITEKIYPEMQFDTTTKEPVIEYILDCPNIDKKKIFNRVKEWCAIMYGDIDAVMRHEDVETGKIIIKGYVEILYLDTYGGLFGGKKSAWDKKKCYHTAMFTIKDNKVKVSIEYVKYIFNFEVIENMGKPFVAKNVDVKLRYLFPITAEYANDMRGRANLITSTMAEFNASVGSLKKYINEIVEDYKF